MNDEEYVKQLEESNMELSMMLLYDREGVRGNKVSFLFGKPLNEIYDILLEHENRNG